MRGTTGKCPGCDSTGMVADPCQERGCKKRGLHFISTHYWERAHQASGDQPDPILGQMVGDFLIVATLGSGGFGCVYLAYQSPLLRLKGALKLINVDTDDAEFSQALLQKFQSEAEVLAHLSHPNIVRLLKYGIHARRPYLVMEFVDGSRTLRDEIHSRTVDGRSFTAEEILAIVNQILNGLGAAHQDSIIHRDIKPENIMIQSVVGNPQYVRLLDFGLAKFVEHQTDTRWHLGSPNYMAPEQISRKNLGPWTDLYAVTVMLFEFLSGRRPFPGATEQEVLVKKIKVEFNPLDEIADLDFPKITLDFLSRGLERDPLKRFQDVEELRSEMTPALEALSDRLEHQGAKMSNEAAQLGTQDLLDLKTTGGNWDPTVRASSIPEPANIEENQATRRVLTPAHLPEDSFSERSAEESNSLDTPEALSSESSLEEPETLEERKEVETNKTVEKEKSRRSGLLLLGLLLVTLTSIGLGGFYFGPGLLFSPSGSKDLEAEATLDDPTAMVTAPDGSQGDETDRDTMDSDDHGAAESEGPLEEGEDSSEDLVEAPRKVLGMALGKFHTCVLLRGGDIRCWGGNFDAELGQGHRRSIGDTEPASAGDIVSLGEPAIAISAAGDYNASFTCALLESRNVRCWGSNHFGQLGLGRDVRRIGEDELPSEIDPIDIGGPVAALTTGAMQYATHACALLENGHLRCWGNNRYGQLGLGHTNHVGRREVPANLNPINVGGEVLQISAGKFHTCALLAGGELKCWGRNQAGQLGYGHTDQIGDDETPADVGTIPVGGKVFDVSAGRSHTCALLDEGRARCWGWNQYGQLGYGHTTNVGDTNLPEDAGDIDAGGKILQISAGGLHTCALLEGGRVRCWGDNRFGQLGYGHRRIVGDDDVPANSTDLHLGGPAVAIEASNYHNCALLEDDTLRCWGLNNFGQLGYGHTNHIGSNEAPASAGPVPAF